MTGTQSRASERLPLAMLALALVAMGVALVVLCSQLTFLLDDWEVLLERRGFSADTFLEPHAAHPAMGIVAFYKAVQATVGMDSLTPYAIGSTLVFLTSVVLLFAWIRRRVGDWLALVAAISVLCLGGAYEDLLTPFQIGYFASVACGLGALLALERRHGAGELVCGVLLFAAVCFQTAGLAFLVGAAVMLAMDGRLRRYWWVVAVPAVLYGLWYLGWGRHDDTTQLSFENIATAPAFMLDGFAAAVASLLGFATTGDAARGSGPLQWGRPLLTAVLALAVFRCVRIRSIPRGALVVLAIAATFWILVAVNASIGRAADTSRYQYIGAILVVMLAAELLNGVRPGRRVLTIVFAVLAVAVASNLATLHRGFEGYRDNSAIVRANLAALDIAADRVDPALVLGVENAKFNYYGHVVAGPYLSAAAEFGSPAYSPAELESASEAARVAADTVLAAALPAESVKNVAEQRTSGPPPESLFSDQVPDRDPACIKVDLTEHGAGAVRLPEGGAFVRSTADVVVRARRFASESFPVVFGTVAGGHPALLRVPTDRSERPWDVVLRGDGVVTMCGGA